MEKAKLHSPNLSQANIQKIAELFPNCIVESKEADGTLSHKVDFDLLQQELSEHIVEGPQERYQLNWPGKREALHTANAPIAKTLRPCREESVEFDTTENLFIEGDNLDALKLLQESYLGKVKMIYIDPPYNTGNDFIYEDDFAESTEDYLLSSQQKDDQGNRLVANTDSNGRFHSDWLSMMYSRLKLARNLLKDDGVIFISIDDNEQASLKRMCDEIFGEDNFTGQITVKSNPRGRDYGGIAKMHEYLIVYSKTKLAKIKNLMDNNKVFPFSDNLGGFEIRELRNRNIAFNSDNRPNLYYPFYLNPSKIDPNGFCEISLEKKEGFIKVLPTESQGFKTVWRWGKPKASENLNINIVGKPMKEKNRYQIVEKYREKSKMSRSIWDEKEVNTERGSLHLKELFGAKLFNFPKPFEMLKKIIEMSSSENDIILDFFAGSSSAAEAIFKQNIEDSGKRKFIMVQLPEACDEKSEAFKAGYPNIAEISKERIRRAGKQIKEANATTTADLDIGFRVLKVDSSNVKDVYYTPDAIDQAELALQVDHIKEDRSAEDLLFQIMLDWGLDLALPVSTESIEGKTVYWVADNGIAACFDNQIDDSFVKALAERTPLRVVFKDSCFETDATKINVAEIFKHLSPETEIKTI